MIYYFQSMSDLTLLATTVLDNPILLPFIEVKCVSYFGLFNPKWFRLNSHGHVIRETKYYFLG